MMSSYGDAMQIADILRENITVIVNVQSLSSTDRARLLDFMAGLKAGLMAQSSRVAEDVYLLAPEHVDMESDEEEADDDDGDRLIIRP
jgi:cell division inhibitor SepF